MSSCLSFLLLLPCGLHAGENAPAIKPAGMFIKESTLPGETRQDDVVPRHAVCLQLAKTRWLIVYTTHGYRGVDDERSVLYQIRKARSPWRHHQRRLPRQSTERLAP